MTLKLSIPKGKTIKSILLSLTILLITHLFGAAFSLFLVIVSIHFLFVASISFVLLPKNYIYF